ncbi:hypothetical protein ACLKA7_001293 [Drosophila subpalustris]
MCRSPFSRTLSSSQAMDQGSDRKHCVLDMSSAHYLAVQRAIAANPRTGPKPLTIEEYRARQPGQAKRNIKDDKEQLNQIHKQGPQTDMGRSVSPMA